MVFLIVAKMIFLRQGSRLILQTAAGLYMDVYAKEFSKEKQLDWIKKQTNEAIYQRINRYTGIQL